MIYSENIHFTKKGIRFTDKHGNKLPITSALKKAAIRSNNWRMDALLFVVHAISCHIPFHSIRNLVFRLSGVKIGHGSVIHMGAKFFNPAGVVIGEDTIIGEKAFLDGRDLLSIGNHVDIASDVMIYNSEHDLESPVFSAVNDKVEIGDYVFVGPRAIILPGVHLGKGAVVAAGAVVTKDVAAGDIVGGLPAKIIGVRKLKDFNYRLGRARLFQ